MAILFFLVILAILVLSHEFGHFIVAKIFGIRVDEFGLGFPPRIFSRKYGETVYSLNWLPFGGFVKIFGEDPTHEVLDSGHKDNTRSLYRKPRYIQAAVIAAGIFFNLILAWFSLSAGFMAGLPVPVGFSSFGPKPEGSTLLITDIFPGSPASEAGLKSGMTITYLATKDSSLEKINPETVSDFISKNSGKEIYLGYKTALRSGILGTIGLGPLAFESETKTVTIIPRSGIIDGRPGIGIAMDQVGILKLPFFDAFYAGGLGVYSLFTGTISGLYSFLAGFFTTGSSSGVSVSGPVGLIGVVGEAANSGLAYLLALTAVISVNLAAINLVPFPALDGGRLFFLAIEALIRRPLNPRIVNTLNITGFVILLGLMIFVTYGDLVGMVSH